MRADHLKSNGALHGPIFPGPVQVMVFVPGVQKAEFEPTSGAASDFDRQLPGQVEFTDLDQHPAASP